jgi:hypothetical protein
LSFEKERFMKIGQFDSLEQGRRAIDHVGRQMPGAPVERGGRVTQTVRFKSGAVRMPAVAGATRRAATAAFIERERAAHAALHPSST